MNLKPSAERVRGHGAPVSPAAPAGVTRDSPRLFNFTPWPVPACVLHAVPPWLLSPLVSCSRSNHRWCCGSWGWPCGEYGLRLACSGLRALKPIFCPDPPHRLLLRFSERKSTQRGNSHRKYFGAANEINWTLMLAVSLLRLPRRSSHVTRVRGLKFGC